MLDIGTYYKRELKRSRKLNRIYFSTIIVLIVIIIILLTTMAGATEAEEVLAETPPVVETMVGYIEDTARVEALEAEIETLQTALEAAQAITYLGDFEVTNYTLREEECGKAPDDPWYGITASGIPVEEGVTIASDWSVLPKGTKVYIQDVGVRVVQDKGGMIKGNTIDVYVEDLEEALQFGRQDKKVWIIEWGE